MLGGGQACWPVARRLVGKLAAAGAGASACATTPQRSTAWSNASTVHSGHEHPYQREIDTAAELAAEVAAYLSLYNEIRSHGDAGAASKVRAQRRSPLKGPPPGSTSSTLRLAIFDYIRATDVPEGGWHHAETCNCPLCRARETARRPQIDALTAGGSS